MCFTVWPDLFTSRHGLYAILTEIFVLPSFGNSRIVQWPQWIPISNEVNPKEELGLPKAYTLESTGSFFHMVHLSPTSPSHQLYWVICTYYVWGPNYLSTKAIRHLPLPPPCTSVSGLFASHIFLLTCFWTLVYSTPNHLCIFLHTHTCLLFVLPHPHTLPTTFWCS